MIIWTSKKKRSNYLILVICMSSVLLYMLQSIHRKLIFRWKRLKISELSWYFLICTLLKSWNKSLVTTSYDFPLWICTCLRSSSFHHIDICIWLSESHLCLPTWSQYYVDRSTWGAPEGQSRAYSLITVACLCFLSRALLKLLEVTDIFETLMKGMDLLPRKRHVQYFACDLRGSIKLPFSPEESIDPWLRTYINSGFEDNVRL